MKLEQRPIWRGFMELVFGDGRKLDFKDNEFDILFSNAVVEHVGGEESQRRFIHEAVRVAKKAFITTPNYWYPVDFHTLLPVVHWLPLRQRSIIYHKLGLDYWADPNNLNLLSPKTFIAMFPPDVKAKLIRQRLFGLTSTIIAIVRK